MLLLKSCTSIKYQTVKEFKFIVYIKENPGAVAANMTKPYRTSHLYVYIFTSNVKQHVLISDQYDQDTVITVLHGKTDNPT